MAPSLVGLGLDIGGTKTAAVLAADDGRVLAESAAGPGNPRFVPPGDARLAVVRSVREVLRAAGIKPAEVARVVAGGPMGPALLAGILAEELPGVPVEFAGEAALALAAGGVHGPAGAVVAGTGSLAAARREDGHLVVVGGWGTVMGDEGSAYAIGRASLRAVARAADGRGPATGLTERLVAYVGGRNARSLVDWVYDPTTSRRDIAALAALTDQVAAGGDAVAIRILRWAGRSLALQVAVALRQAGWERGPVPVVAAGRVLGESRLVRAALGEALALRCPQAFVVMPRRSLAEAAALQAAGGSALDPGERPDSP